MNAPAHQILLKVDDRVFGYLTKLAAKDGGSAALYAQQLFEAAYSVRCRVHADPALSDAIAERTSSDKRSGAPSAAESAARLALAARDQEIGRLRRELNEARDHSVREAQAELIATLEARLEEAAGSLASASDALELKQDEADALGRERSDALDEVQRLMKLADHWHSEFCRELARADAAELALKTASQPAPAPVAVDLSELAAAIAEIRGVTTDLKDVAADHRLQSDQLDQIYKRTRIALEARSARPGAPNVVEAESPIARPCAPEPAPEPQPENSAAPRTPQAPRAKKADQFVWKKSWGRGR